MRRHLLRLMALTLLFAGSARAGQAFFDFNTDPTTSGLLKIYGTGGGLWSSTDGVGVATNANDGFLQITAAANDQSSQILFADIDNGAVVKAFTFEADLRIGNGTQSPADGFSLNYARANDPVVLSAAVPNATVLSGFAVGPQCGGGNLPEEGTVTGIAIGFDAWNSGGSPPYCDGFGNSSPNNIGPDVIGISVRVDGILVDQISMPTLNGSATDPTSLQTGPYDASQPGSYFNLGWAHLKVVLDTNGMLTVVWKGSTVLSNYQTTFFPSAGRLVFAGRTGNSNQNQDIDNISITTIPAALAQVGTATGFVDGFSLDVSDSGSSVIDTNKPITAKLNGNTVTSTVTKTGPTTTIAYHGFPALLPSGSSNYVSVSMSDTNNNAITGARSFTAPIYNILPGSDAVAGVNTATRGFKILPWASGAEPNAVYWMLEQLAGLHGTNEADLTTATDAGRVDWTGVVNFDIAGPDGNFRAPNYPDTPFPGIPSINGHTGSTAENMQCFLQFQNPGIYTMGVNSDDGFLVSEGKNPNDWFSLWLGDYNGGRGASDTLFNIVVTNAGFYPVRLAWENGNGDSGNGANCEWFLVKNGVKYLLNDTDPTNTTGVTAYYAGPGLPAYVSAVRPNPGGTGALADRLFAQLTDAGTTVSGTPTFYVNGAAKTPTVTKSGPVSTVRLQLSVSDLMPIGSNFVALVWSDSANNSHSNTWSFTTAPWVTLDPNQSFPVGTQDTSKPGFILHVAQVDPCLPHVINPGGPDDCGDGTATQIDSANALIVGLYYPWYGTNAADVSTAVASNMWYWNAPIDFNVVTSPGDFTLDAPLPGIPSADGVASLPNNSLTAWFDSYVVFPTAGPYVMTVNSDDGFRVTEGWGVSRQVLHITGTNVDTDVAAVVTTKANTGGSWQTDLPAVPITAPVVYVDGSQCPGPTTMDLTGKIALIDQDRCSPGNNAGYNRLVAMCQSNGALACIVLAFPSWGTPEVMTGSGATITIPSLHVNGFNGQQDWWHTNGPLNATIGADTHLMLGQADVGKGMSDVDFLFNVPQAGVYPIHLTFMQGGGGVGLEWSRLMPDDTRVLMNDSGSANSLMAFRAVTVQPRPSLSLGRSGNSVIITYTGTLQSSATVNGTYTDVAGANSPYTVPTGSATMKFYKSRN